MSKNLHIKTGDTVKVLSGKVHTRRNAKGASDTGKVLAVDRTEGKVIVEGLNKVTKHVKPKQMGEQGGLVQAEAAMYACKVQLVCPKCNQATRVGHVVEDGKKFRVCKKCGAKF